MSQSQRQSNLFAAENFTKIYKSFQDVDFRAYDFDTLKQAMIEYIQLHYPEDFNDYIESSEYIAMIELLAYLGTNLSFRMDLNSRENFIDTAERRESIIRLASMVNYQAKRNLAANGLFKIVAVQTSEPVTDSLNRNLAGSTIFWDDPNNIDSYEQFTTIMNAAFQQANPFGKPTKSGTVGGILTDLYQMNSVTGIQVAYPIQLVVNNESLPFDICNVDFDDGEDFFERAPDPNNAFNIVSRNDGQGFSSANTGFFVYFRQGELVNIDNRYDFPIKNRVQDYNLEDVNNTDVYIQEINDNGDVEQQWTQVEYAVGNESVFFNGIESSIRSIYSVATGANDTVSVNYADGNFGDIPTGIIRAWLRSSANDVFTIRPEEAKNLEITIPYIGEDTQTYLLRVIFSLEESVSNAAATETDEEIKVRAPQVYYTQDRMVNNEDYNVFPLSQGNQIEKLKTINRTHAGHSRYIDINDPTGFHQNLLINSDDGILYKDAQTPFLEVPFNPETDNARSITTTNVENFLRDRLLTNFFYDNYLSEYKRIKENEWVTTSPYNKFNVFELMQNAYWQTDPSSVKSNTGFIILDGDVVYDFNPATADFGDFIFYDEGAKVKFAESPTSEQFIWATVNTITQGTGNVNLDEQYMILDVEIPEGWLIQEILPNFRREFINIELDAITLAITNTSDFGLTYLIDSAIIEDNVITKYGRWFTRQTINTIDSFTLANTLQDWLVRTVYNADPTDPNYNFYSRGTRYVFESYSDVRFYSDEFNQNNFNIEDLTSELDTINILPTNTRPNTTEIWSLENNTWVNSENSALNYNVNFIILKDRSVDSDNATAEIVRSDNTSEDITTKINNGILELTTVSNKSNGAVININYTSNLEPLGIPGVFNVFNAIYETSGLLNTSKVEVIPADTNRDGIPDEPFLYQRLANPDSLIFETVVTDVDNSQSIRAWTSLWDDFRSTDFDLTTVPTLTTLGEPVLSFDELKDEQLFLMLESQQSAFKTSAEYYVLDDIFSGENSSTLESDLAEISENILFVEARESISGDIITVNTDNFSPMQNTEISSTGKQSAISAGGIFRNSGDTSPEARDVAVKAYMNDPLQDAVLLFSNSTNHYAFLGRSFTLNENSVYPVDFDYKWKHIAPADHRIDPSVSNLMDMIILTNTYYSDVLLWRDQGLSISEFPVEPTTESLRVSFSDFDDFKMMSDEIIYNPASFKVIFGQQADAELQATFNVVKVPTTLFTDSEIKTRVVQAIYTFFDIQNWDFGETFYFTELAAYIHQELSGIIGSVIIVPSYSESQFGDLFELKIQPNQLFMPTTTAADIEIVNNLTETNMRLN